MNKDLETIYREQLENHTPTPPEETWQIIARRMHKQALWRTAVYSTAVLVGIGLVSGFVFYYKSSSGQDSAAPSPTAEDTTVLSHSMDMENTLKTNIDLTFPKNINITDSNVSQPLAAPQAANQTRSVVPVALPSSAIHTTTSIEMPSVIQPITNIATEPAANVAEKTIAEEKVSSTEDTSSSVSPWSEAEKLKIPNAFTPNDVTNNIFKPAPAEASEYEMYIYNRFGAKVFHSKHIEHGWDGTYNGSNSPAGTYVYIIVYADRKGIRHEQKGQVHLIR